MFSADSALADIIDYIGIDARPVHYLSCLYLHLVYPLMCSKQVSKGAIE